MRAEMLITRSGRGEGIGGEGHRMRPSIRCGRLGTVGGSAIASIIRLGYNEMPPGGQSNGRPGSL